MTKPPMWVDSDPRDEGHDEAPEPIRVASVLVLLRRRYVVIVTATLGVAAAALALTLRAEKTYEASTNVLVATPDSDAPELASELPGREVAANLELLELRPVKDRVNDRLEEPFTGSIDVTTDDEQSSLATITISAFRSPARRARGQRLGPGIHRAAARARARADR